MYAMVAIQAALAARTSTGVGAHVDLALLDTQVATLANQALNFLVSGAPPRRLGNAHPNLVPYQVFPTADGDIVIAVGSDAQFARLDALLELGGIATDARGATNAARVANRELIVARVAAATRLHRREDLLARLEAALIPAGPIHRVDEVFADPQVQARGVERSVIMPDGTIVPAVAPPWRFGSAPPPMAGAAPRLGAHTAAVRREIADRGAGSIRADSPE
jgi:crotonobetainyl-CoA:carnitine CoA-transferase CaiB-like acyl-CoA transferase